MKKSGTFLAAFFLLTGLPIALFSQKYVRIETDVETEILINDKEEKITLRANEIYQLNTVSGEIKLPKKETYPFNESFLLFGEYLIPVSESLETDPVTSIVPFTNLDIFSYNDSTKEIEFSLVVDSIYTPDRPVLSLSPETLRTRSNIKLLKFVPKNIPAPVLILTKSGFDDLFDLFQERKSTTTGTTFDFPANLFDKRFIDFTQNYWIVPLFWLLIGGLLTGLTVFLISRSRSDSGKSVTKPKPPVQPAQADKLVVPPGIDAQAFDLLKNIEDKVTEVSKKQTGIENKFTELLLDKQQEIETLGAQLNEKNRQLEQKSKPQVLILAAWGDLPHFKRFIQDINENIKKVFSTLKEISLDIEKYQVENTIIRYILSSYFLSEVDANKARWESILQRIDKNEGEIIEENLVETLNPINSEQDKIRIIKEHLFVEFLGNYIGKTLVLWEELSNLPAFAPPGVQLDATKVTDPLKYQCRQCIKHLLDHARNLDIDISYFELFSFLEKINPKRNPKNDPTAKLEDYYRNAEEKARTLKEKEKSQYVVARVTLYGYLYEINNLNLNVPTLVKMI